MEVPRSSLWSARDSSEMVDRQLQLACVLTIVETIGALDALFEMTRLYAIDRIALGGRSDSFRR